MKKELVVFIALFIVCAVIPDPLPLMDEILIPLAGVIISNLLQQTRSQIADKASGRRQGELAASETYDEDATDQVKELTETKTDE